MLEEARAKWVHWCWNTIDDLPRVEYGLRVWLRETRRVLGIR